MKKLIFAGVCTILLALDPVFSIDQERIGDFSLLDDQGYFHHMAWYNEHAVIALLVQAYDSAATARALPKFNALKQRYSEQGVQFFLINPLGGQDRNLVHAEMHAMGVDIPVLMDDTQVVLEALGIEQVGEVLLYDPAKFSLVSRGPAGDELEAAIEARLAGNGVAVAKVSVDGEPVSYTVMSQQVSYVNDIAPMIADNCAECHRDGGVAPFALDSYNMLKG